jgi:hypothetical protein
MLGDEMRQPPDTMLGGRPPDLLPDLLDRGRRLAVRLDAHLVTRSRRPYTQIHPIDAARPPALRQPD